MLYTLSPPHHISHCCFHTHPINLHSSHRHHHRLHHRPSNPRTRSSHSSTGIFYSLPTIDEHQNHQNQHHDINDSEFFNRFYNSSSVNLNNPPRECEIEEDRDRDRGESSSGIFTNMWWADLKAAVGQRINVKGILFTVSVITRHRNWMTPHVWVPDVRYIDWAALKRKGFEGVVFDKDNTLTVPYYLWVCGGRLPRLWSLVGDRPFTDIVYGNRNGFLTILTSPLSLAEETFIVKQVRKIELALLNWWLRKGLKPANPRLLPDALDCVREPPPI
ncbi:putative PGP phosphatase, mitochondrial/chloroplastic [Helianthus debilis subsp. tardiflorus]